MADYDLILLGAGGAHLAVLRRLALVARPKAKIALLVEAPYAWCASRLAAMLSGKMTYAQGQIALAALCQAAQVELILGKVESLEADTRIVSLSDGRMFAGHWLSLDAGSTFQAPPHQGDAMQVLSARPLEPCLQQFEQWRAEPKRLAVLGGTPVSVELALALADQVPSLTLFCGGPLLPEQGLGLRMRALGYLRQRGVQVREHCPISRIEDDWLLSGDEPVWRGRRLLVSSGARGWPWLSNSGLACDEEGFVLIEKSLQSRSHPQIFAAGECASLPDIARSLTRRPRQGRILASNLSAALAEQPLKHYRAPRHGLTLIADNRGNALASWRNWSADGALYGNLRRFLERRFLLRHRF